MCNEADSSGQDIQDEAKSGLWGERKEAGKKLNHHENKRRNRRNVLQEQDPASTDLKGDEYCAGTDGESNHSHEGTHDQV